MRQRERLIFSRCCVVVVALAAVPHRLIAQSTEIIHGKVVDMQKKPIEGVDVVVTGQAGGGVQTTRTDKKGEYTVAFREPQGNYSLSFRKVGYGAFTKTARQVGLSNILEVGDAVLPGGLTALQPLVANTNTMRRVPARGEIPSIGTSEMNTANNGLFLLDPGDLNALAALLPGVTPVTDSGFSVYGAPPSQNKTVIDGVDFGGGNLPRDGIAREKVVTNTFDASKGQFAGAETVVTTKPGSDFFAATLRTQLVDPHLAWADPQSPTPVPQIGYWSGYVTGPIKVRKLNFIASFDVSDRVTAFPSLLLPRASLLSQLGVSSDSIAAATHALTTLGVPLTGDAIPTEPSQLQGSTIVRVDYRATGVTTITLSAIGNWSRISGLGVSELAFPSTSGESHRGLVRYQLKAGTYFHRFLEDFTTSLSPQSSSRMPYTALLSGSVFVGAAYDDGRTGLTSFRFGGGGSGESQSSGNSWDAENEISWSTPNTRNQFKFTQEFRVDWGSSLQTSNQYGAFTYQSLSDLAANLPSSFSRTLSSVSVANQMTIAALSFGDIWRAIPGKLDFQAGARFDSRTFGTTPGYNATVDSLFGVRTDRVPSDQGISPRFGFSWRPGARRSNVVPDGMVIIGPNGETGSRGYRTPLDAAGLALSAAGSDVAITGGFGAYRGVILSGRIGALTDATGLPSTTQYLSCVGTATPVADWSPLATSPSSCADGSTATPYAVTQPHVTVFDPSFRAPVSWRGNIQVNGWHFHGWAIAPQVTYSVGVNSESWIDQNLRRTAAFSLAGEANRPVFANVADIVPATGLFAPGASRISSSYGRVTDILSDLQDHAAQLTVPFAPPKPLFGKIPIYFVYSYNVGRREQRGFGGTTAGDPFAVEWVDGQQALHQFIIGAANIKLWWFTLATRLNILSGIPYTPVVAQDINGDGLANDRAFVANPATVADTALASQMSALIAQAPAGARQCLQAQLGTIAGTNSCRTPWQAQLDLNLAFTPPQSLGTGSRLRVTTTFLNAGGALVRLFGLENTLLGQSAASTNVDPRLLYVTGFDPVNQRFQYHVNQLFGEPLDYGTARRRYPPFELQLGVEYRLGYPSTAQTARNVGVYPTGNDTTGMAERLRQDLLRRMTGNPVAPILALRDSLALTPDQVAGIDAENRRFMRVADSLIGPVVAFLVRRGKKLTSDEYNSRMMTISPPIRVLAADALQKATAFLLPDQRSKLAALTRRGGV